MKSLLSLWIFDWRKLLAYCHRWLGIAGCVLFVAWFVSGVVMMYARMPGLANEERLARAPALDLSRITLPPAEAAAQIGLDVDRVQVGMLQGRPVYRFGGREQTIVFADTGELFEGIAREEAEEIARRYAPGHTASQLVAADAGKSSTRRSSHGDGKRAGCALHTFLSREHKYSGHQYHRGKGPSEMERSWRAPNSCAARRARRIPVSRDTTSREPITQPQTVAGGFAGPAALLAAARRYPICAPAHLKIS